MHHVTLNVYYMYFNQTWQAEYQIINIIRIYLLLLMLIGYVQNKLNNRIY